MAPQPRFRIYTAISTYIRIFFEFLIGQTNRGNSVSVLEKKIAQMAGVKHAICTPTARTGIYLSLKNLIKPGQEVILSPITIVDVINMVLCAGGRPVFADVEPNTCNIDANKIESLINKDTGAIFITHLHGLACDVKKIKEISDRHSIPLVEDAAQAFSTKVQEKWMGSFGTAGIFSFGMYKVVNAFFGGMIITNDDSLNQKIRESMKNYPLMPNMLYLKKAIFGFLTDLSTSPIPFSIFTYWLFRWGYLNKIGFLNDLVTVDRIPKRQDTIPDFYLCRMKPLQARLILSQLSNVEKNNQKRIKTASSYYDGLKNLNGAILPPATADGSHIYTYYAFRCADRHALMRFCLKKNRDFVLSHYHNTASLEVFKEFFRDCPNAEATAKELVYLPTYPRYKQSQIDKNIQAISAYYQVEGK